MPASLLTSTAPESPTSLRSAITRWAPLALVFLGMGLATAMAFPFQNLFLTQAVHASPVQVAAYLMAAPIAGVGVATVLGRLSDRRPIRRLVLLGGSIAAAGGMAAFAVVRDYWAVLAVGIGVMSLAGGVLPQAFAYARLSVQGSRAAMTTSMLRTLFSIAWVAGPPVAALVLARSNFVVVYLVAAGLWVVTALIVFTLLPEPKPVTVTVPETSDPRSAGAGDAPALVIWLVLAAFVASQCGGGLNVQSLPLFITKDLGGAVGDSGLILGLCAALEVPLMLGFGALSTRMPLRRLILAGPVFGVIYFLIGVFATHTWELAAGQVANAALIAVVQGLGISYVQDLLPRNPGRAATLVSNTFSLGQVLAGSVIGVADRFGPRLSYGVGLGLAVLAFTLLAASRAVQIRTARAGAPEPFDLATGGGCGRPAISGSLAE